MKESKHTDVLNKRLAELVAKDWRVITLASLEETGAGLLGEDVKTIGQNGSFFCYLFTNASATGESEGPARWFAEQKSSVGMKFFCLTC